MVVAIGIAIALLSSRPSDGLLWLLVLIPVNMVTGRIAAGRSDQPPPT